MNKYIELTKKGIADFNVYFDLNLFTEIQEKILLKYENRDELIFENIGSKKFIEKFDKYILHCIEETIEARDEIRKNVVSAETIEELCDILMYLGTMNSFIKINLDRYEMKTDKSINFVYNVSTRNANEIDVKLMDIVNLLTDQRRLFPQRKWHKPSKELSELQMKYNLVSMYKMNIDAIKIILDLVLNATTTRPNIINELVTKKENFTLSLPIPNK